MPRGHEWCSNGPNGVSVKLIWAKWGRHLGQMEPNEAQVWPRWGPMRLKRSPNGAQWDPSGAQDGFQMHSKRDSSSYFIVDARKCHLHINAVAAARCACGIDECDAGESNEGGAGESNDGDGGGRSGSNVQAQAHANDGSSN